MDILYQIDTDVAGAFQQNTLMNNLIYFITTRTAVTQTIGKSTQKHMVKFTGDAAYVFNTPTQASLFSSVQGDCIAVPKLDYRVTEGSLRFQIDSEVFMSSTLCKSMFVPEDSGYAKVHRI